ncbi:carboxylating nicotinate-nucleotide diphosphorylase [Eubacterium coprostanoligenes]|uniref:Probable nicotinate-nucleotide pyrophosphorylase [carboxylating] n=2 Tax=Eubacterium coprostanoligenes TaxID=290054 RepID=A0A1T4LYH2_9FIRM|nr:carboxylating nicotinate-nucleotide diphosphorylase [Eubacterium coprostanoligenes]MCI6254515.1 carboxylating nicotinate-nucleotide diphosphorylase [Eubacterium coprostanoligenes]MDY4698896.1 carboxylating nicotinate-nucleotide diphosphorylase [Eubacterium coprostanoligenes]MDY5377131.1 carboxylating nicotinate-nucleotide diphosphorylase [Eubacterium coprostanoligenes]MDY5399755.1 carboxylating nicotinate-nucleotide diphosphorylase [Eubacterium coprostanoligenes]SJZ59691.1 nicotinate-nucleo
MLNGVTMKINVDDYIINTLKEDITSEDVSTNAVMPEDKQGRADLICKQDGIVCGLDVFERTFKILDDTSRFEANFKDGDFVKKGDLIGVIYGDVKAILSGERTALNYLQRMSGIATMTREYVNELDGYKTVLLDTRKTTPNMRPFEKHAVKVGGATNHRYNLSDGVLLKDNHIGAAGSVTKAIEMAKAYAPFVRKIEIETETLEQVKEALDAGADIIMLDNMDNDTMRKAVEMIDGKAQTECSGNVTKERLKEIAEIGVDFVSCGALTHSAMIMDVSLKNLKTID